MNNFVFYNPTRIIFGKGTIPLTGTEIKKYDVDRLLLIAGGGSIKKNGVYQAATKSLSRNGISWEEHWGVRPNPTLEHAREAISIIKEHNLQGILAVGGGSVIDEAKAIAAGYYLDDIWNAFDGSEVINKALPLFTVLTLSGTCSEMDPVAVLSKQDELKKWPVRSEHIFPKVSFIDPTVQMTLPRHQTVNGAVDAMSHILEHYFIGSDQEVTIALNESLMNTIIKSTDKLIQDKDDYSARANLAWSATLALNGISGAALTGDWTVHAIEHGLSALHPEIAHGAGLAVLYPAWIRYNYHTNKPQFERWAKNVWHEKSLEKATEKMQSKFAEWGAPLTLRDLNIKENELEQITELSLRGETVGVIKEHKRSDVLEILKMAY